MTDCPLPYTGLFADQPQQPVVGGDVVISDPTPQAARSTRGGAVRVPRGADDRRRARGARAALHRGDRRLMAGGA